jgi:hypothetical protein
MKMRWMQHPASTTMTNAQRFSVESLKGRYCWQYKGTDWEDSVKIGIRETVCSG